VGTDLLSPLPLALLTVDEDPPGSCDSSNLATRPSHSRKYTRRLCGKPLSGLLANLCVNTPPIPLHELGDFSSVSFRFPPIFRLASFRVPRFRLSMSFGVPFPPPFRTRLCLFSLRPGCGGSSTSFFFGPPHGKSKTPCCHTFETRLLRERPLDQSGTCEIFSFSPLVDCDLDRRRFCGFRLALLI